MQSAVVMMAGATGTVGGYEQCCKFSGIIT